MNEQPGWAGNYSAVRRCGRWVVPLVTESGAKLLARELQGRSGVTLRAVRDCQSGWNVEEDV